MADKVKNSSSDNVDVDTPAAKKMKLSPAKGEPATTAAADNAAAEPKPEAAKESKGTAAADSVPSTDNAVADTPMAAEPSPKKAAVADEKSEIAAEPKPTDKPAESSSTQPVTVDRKVAKVGADDTDAKPPSSLEASIIRQVEYYFGDANLARDKFLQTEIEKDNGWVPLTVLLTFKRLASLCSDATVIVTALKKSDEGLIEIGEDNAKVRRHPERPLAEQNEETRKEVVSRTAYVKGFGADAQMEQLIDFFLPYDRVVNIVMRKYLDKPTKTYKFKGSAFVTFQSREQCAEFLKKEKVCFNEMELVRKWQCEYSESKKLERETDKKKNAKKVPEPQINLPTGAVIHLDGLGEKTSRETIREKFIELGECAWADE